MLLIVETRSANFQKKINNMLSNRNRLSIINKATIYNNTHSQDFIWQNKVQIVVKTELLICFAVLDPCCWW